MDRVLLNNGFVFAPFLTLTKQVLAHLLGKQIFSGGILTFFNQTLSAHLEYVIPKKGVNASEWGRTLLPHETTAKAEYCLLIYLVANEKLSSFSHMNHFKLP